MSLGGMINAGFGSDKPDLRKIEIVKNVPIQQQIDQGVGSNQRLMNFSDQSIQDFLNLFAKNTPQVDRYTNEGIAQLDRLYNPGGLEMDLSGLRDSARSARMGATERALARLTAADKSRAASLGMPGSSSYRDFSNARLTRDAMIDADLADEAQKRADYMFTLSQRLGNLGNRQAMLTAPEARYTEGVQRVGAMGGVPLQNLGALTQLDQANKWYGLYRKRDTLERIADFGDEGMKTLGQLSSIYSNVACWIARAAYGEDNPRWMLFRQWLFTKASAGFLSWYLQNGQSVAPYVKSDSRLRAAVRRWMDKKIAEL